MFWKRSETWCFGDFTTYPDPIETAGDWGCPLLVPQQCCSKGKAVIKRHDLLPSWVNYWFEEKKENPIYGRNPQ